MPTWTIKADRRRADIERLHTRLLQLADTVDGLTLQLVTPEDFSRSKDRGKLRDFAPVAHLTHRDVRALEIAGEELIVEFGWTVDLSRQPGSS